MKWSLPLPRLSGIETRIHASFLLLLAWVAYSAYGSTGSVVGAVFGVAFVTTMFGAVLLHELGHALVARRYGIATRAITLYPIGGIAELMGQAQSPRQDALIAVAGPAVNFALAAIFGAVFWLGGLTGIGGTFVRGLAWANLGLGAFNLLPAFPMDGGRVLRASLTGRLGHLKATEIAVGIGRVAALALGAYGLFDNAWLIVIAGVLWVVGGRELRHARWMHAAREGVGRVNPGATVTHSGRYFKAEVIDPSRRNRGPGSEDPFLREFTAALKGRRGDQS